jgi:hypothetical protein
MDCNTGHLVTQEMVDAMDAHHRGDYTAVPSELNHAATATLAGRHEAQVSLTSGGKLSKFAAQTRKQRRLMAKQSRKQNRA